MQEVDHSVSSLFFPLIEVYLESLKFEPVKSQVFQRLWWKQYPLFYFSSLKIWVKA